MVANTRLFWVLAGFFFAADIAYFIWNITFAGENTATVAVEGTGFPVEWVGTVGLTLSAILASLIAFYLGRIHSSQGGELPEDNVSANIDDGDAEQGFFSPWSWWPVMLAGGAALVFLGVAVGVWIIYIGVTLAAISLVGLMFEYYRGNFAR